MRCRCSRSIPCSWSIFGIGPTPIIFTGVLYAAMSVLIGTLSGLDHIPRVLRKTAKVHRLGLLATIVRIYIPACSAEILGGITLSVSYAFVAVIASEFLLAPAGIGHAIADAYTTFQIERMYGLMLALALLVVVINSGLRGPARAPGAGDDYERDGIRRAADIALRLPGAGAGLAGCSPGWSAPSTLPSPLETHAAADRADAAAALPA